MINNISTLDNYNISTLDNYNKIINTANQDKKNETLFINLSLKEIFINLISACIDILNEFLDLKEFTLTNYIKILSKDDRLIYVGIILIIISILLFI
jgi:hypothetical protein